MPATTFAELFGAVFPAAADVESGVEYTDGVDDFVGTLIVSGGSGGNVVAIEGTDATDYFDAKFAAIVGLATAGGLVLTSGPVDVLGVIAQIVIADDYLATNGRAFTFTVDPVTGLDIADAVGYFGGIAVNKCNWLVTTTVAEVTVDSAPKWRVSFDLTTADTAHLAPGPAKWSMEIRGSTTNNMTKILGKTELVSAYTQP